MKDKIKQIASSSFFQLLVVYTLLVCVISLNFFWKYSLHFEVFAVILAILGISVVNKGLSQEINKYHYPLFVLAIIITLFSRILPYLRNSIPLGYDAGIYQYGIASGAGDWVKTALTPGFIYLMKLFSLVFTSHAILVGIFILFNLALGISVYFVAREYFGRNVGVIAFLFYAVSIIQFKVFTYMYYKNVIALSLALWAFYFLKKEKRVPFIIFGALTGAMHQPTFFIFGLSYILFIIRSKFSRKSIVDGIAILLLTGLFYIGSFKQAILPLILPVVSSFMETGTAPGTFINFFTYQYSTLAYLPFALLGFFYLIKRRQFDMVFFWTLITAVIVYFQFFFFNRFIIHLDIALIMLAAVGFSLVVNNKKTLGIIITVAMLASAGFVTFNAAMDTKPLITEDELEVIQYLSNTEEESFVMTTSSVYSPWVLGYSDRKTIAPGLFDYNKHNQQQWNEFWTSSDIEDIKAFMNVYDKPLYVFIGQKQKDNLWQFLECFSIYYNNGDNKIYRYLC